MPQITPSIPIVDISAFTCEGDFESRKQAALDFAEKCHPTGCIGISGHGIPAGVLENAFQLSKKLFSLPYEEKMKAPHPNGWVPHRGYSGVGSELAGAKSAAETEDKELKASFLKAASDCKESYEIGSEENKIQYNIWLLEEVLPGFRQTTIGLFWTLNKLCDQILDAFSMSLNLTEDETKHIHKLHTGHDNQLRLLHYPSLSKVMGARDDIGRLAAHTDFSTFTILFQDTQSGLEFGNHENGEFLPATTKDGVLYLNIGDMGQRLSNGFYPSGLHRVVVAGKERGEATPARYSIPFFCSPPPLELIEPQHSLVVAHGKQVYEPTTMRACAMKATRGLRIGADDISQA